MILAPGTRQTVRVSWLGTPNPSRELTYRIVVTQVPLTLLDRASAGDHPVGKMQLMLHYRGTLFIRPPRAAPQIGVAAAQAVTTADGEPALAITLENAGTAVGLVKSCTVRLRSKAGGPRIMLSPVALAALRNTRVLGGGRRRYMVAWPADLTPGVLTATGQCVVDP
jgi:fimbrial chaperone protein